MERAVITLERAFASDPLFTWMFPDPRQRSRSLRLFLRVPLQYGLRYGHVTESNGGMAVAIWLPPGQKITAGGMIRCGMLSIPFSVGVRPFVRFAGDGFIGLDRALGMGEVSVDERIVQATKLSNALAQATSTNAG